MKSKIYLYLFIFSALIALYLGVSSMNKDKNAQLKLDSSEARLIKLEDSLQQAQLRVLDM